MTDLEIRELAAELEWVGRQDEELFNELIDRLSDEILEQLRGLVAGL